MSDVPEADRTWFTEALPEGTYKSDRDVLKAVGLMPAGKKAKKSAG